MSKYDNLKTVFGIDNEEDEELQKLQNEEKSENA